MQSSRSVRQRGVAGTFAAKHETCSHGMDDRVLLQVQSGA